jgi:hypothetical protein
MTGSNWRRGVSGFSFSGVYKAPIGTTSLEASYRISARFGNKIAGGINQPSESLGRHSSSDEYHHGLRSHPTAPSMPHGPYLAPFARYFREPHNARLQGICCKGFGSKAGKIIGLWNRWFSSAT